MDNTYYSNGKLLLSAEYGILDGALALAVPTKYGQYLTITNSESKSLTWVSLDEKKETWFQASFDSNDFEVVDTSDRRIADTLQGILRTASVLNPQFAVTTQSKKVTTNLTFPRNWGLGTSSTLINNIANWAHVDPYQLLERTMGGSGYDIACANANFPIYYQLTNQSPSVEKVAFNPSFKDRLFFVYLNQKQDSRVAIENYRRQNFDKAELVRELTELTQKISTAAHLDKFELLITEHESLLSKVLKMEPVKSRLFVDYHGAIKSLGGWGGDFVLTTGNEKTPDYFKAKGFDVVIPYSEMVLL